MKKGFKLFYVFIIFVFALSVFLLRPNVPAFAGTISRGSRANYRHRRPSTEATEDGAISRKSRANGRHRRAASTYAGNDRAISWGLKSNNQRRLPIPPTDGAKILAENGGIFFKDGDEKKVYLTFDLGYEAGYTAEVLDVLKENNVKAVFFVCGHYLKEKELINRILAEGHSVGNHTDGHKDLPKLPNDAVKKDIATLQQNFKNLYDDAPMIFFRPPKGRFNDRVLKIASGEGLKTVLWSIAIEDWTRTPIDAKACADKIEQRLHCGAIILSHIANSGTPEMLRLLLSKIESAGYTVGTPEELL
jgi:peptidoglycan-N-acetylmuramic acid deacetylase